MQFKYPLNTIPLIIIISATITGCGLQNANTDPAEPQNITENMDQEEITEKIKETLWESYEFKSETAVLGAAQRLCDAGCSIPKETSLISQNDQIYVIRIMDEKENEFRFTMDIDGYIGPITDKNGNDLYSPVD